LDHQHRPFGFAGCSFHEANSGGGHDLSTDHASLEDASRLNLSAAPPGGVSVFGAVSNGVF
jgi:hypothetical protein